MDCWSISALRYKRWFALRLFDVAAQDLLKAFLVKKRCHSGETQDFLVHTSHTRLRVQLQPLLVR